MDDVLTASDGLDLWDLGVPESHAPSAQPEHKLPLQGSRLYRKKRLDIHMTIEPDLWQELIEYAHKCCGSIEDVFVDGLVSQLDAEEHRLQREPSPASETDTERSGVQAVNRKRKRPTPLKPPPPIASWLGKTPEELCFGDAEALIGARMALLDRLREVRIDGASWLGAPMHLSERFRRTQSSRY